MRNGSCSFKCIISYHFHIIAFYMICDCHLSFFLILCGFHIASLSSYACVWGEGVGGVVDISVHTYVEPTGACSRSVGKLRSDSSKAWWVGGVWCWHATSISQSLRMTTAPRVKSWHRACLSHGAKGHSEMRSLLPHYLVHSLSLTHTCTYRHSDMISSVLKHGNPGAL